MEMETFLLSTEADEFLVFEPAIFEQLNAADLVLDIDQGEEIDLSLVLEQLKQVMGASSDSPQVTPTAESVVADLSQAPTLTEPVSGGDEIYFHLVSHETLTILYDDVPSSVHWS